MKKFAIVLLSVLMVSPAFSGQINKGRVMKKHSLIKPPIKPDPVQILPHIPTNRAESPFQYQGRDGQFSAVLIDSSLNGYGAYSGAVNPLAFHPDRGYLAVYRQMHGRIETNCTYGNCSTAGYIGASQCEDDCMEADEDMNPENWYAAQKLNTTYPQGSSEPELPTAGFIGPTANNPPLSGLPQGRYPSAGMTEEGFPYAIWNEYTDQTFAGGEYGGYPLYTLDYDTDIENSDWQNTQIVNAYCNPVPCDPVASDFWVGNAQVYMAPDAMTGGMSPRLAGLYSGGLGGSSTEFFMITSSSNFYGFFNLNYPYVIASNTETSDGDFLWLQSTEDGSYHARPDFHINSDGVGYMVFTSIVDEPSHQNGEPSMRTLFYKKTEDYGETWDAIEVGLRGTSYGFISDQLLLDWSDSLNTMYSSNPDRYPTNLWYPGTLCDSTDESTGDIIQYNCGDTVRYSNVNAPLVLTQGLYLSWDFDMRTDEDGGLHVVAGSMPLVCHDTLYVTGSGCADNDGDGVADSNDVWQYGSTGQFYFYNPDPASDPDGWTITEMVNFDSTNNAEYLNQMALLDDAFPLFYMFPEITMSIEDGSQVMWFATFMASAYTDDPVTEDLLASDIDIFVRKSTDLGKTWTDLVNVTNTPGDITRKVPEVALHLASHATDEEVSMFYHVPYLNGAETVTGATGMEDYVNRVYVGTYYNDQVSGSTVSTDEELVVAPRRFNLEQNYPNPFNPVTNIAFELDRPGEVLIELFDMKGARVQTVLNETRKSGKHEFLFNGSSLASGVYLYSMTHNGITQTRKLVLMK